MRADNQLVVNPSARGRDSIRISSQNAYDEAIIVLDLSHMPAGCATWPAFWTLSQAGPWPNGGEIDIIEGMGPPSFSSPPPNHSRVDLLPYRCQFEHAESSHFAHYPWVHNCPPRCEPDTNWVSLPHHLDARTLNLSLNEK